MPKKGAPPPPQKPEGAGKKRTPTSAYDPAAGKDVYEPEKIIGQRLTASAKAPLVADGAAGGSNDPMPAPPKPGVPESAPLPDPPEPLTKKRKVSLSSLVGGKIKKEVVATLPTAFDELEAYLAEADEEDFDIKLLTWWHAKETKWPNLAKMVKQYLSAPASSAGVERVFSAAGNMHGDLQKSAKDTTLEHSLFAAFNTD